MILLQVKQNPQIISVSAGFADFAFDGYSVYKRSRHYMAASLYLGLII